jgi:hypothetical protein
MIPWFNFNKSLIKSKLIVSGPLGPRVWPSELKRQKKNDCVVRISLKKKIKILSWWAPRLNEWMNYWMNEWLKELMNEWLYEWINEWMNY